MLTDSMLSPGAAPVTWNARCTTTSAWRNASRSISASRTSPRRYFVFVQPCAAGSNGCRATPVTCATRSSASSRGIRPRPQGAGHAGHRDRQVRPCLRCHQLSPSRVGHFAKNTAAGCCATGARSPQVPGPSPMSAAILAAYAAVWERVTDVVETVRVAADDVKRDIMDRLKPLDAVFVDAEDEDKNTSMAIASIAVFEGPAPSHEEVMALIADRLPFLPRYRQKLRTVPFRLGPPVWVDDPDFDLGYHIRRTALPEPGEYRQLADLMAARDVAPARPRSSALGVLGGGRSRQGSLGTDLQGAPLHDRRGRRH